jgi:hypothetical protein
MMQAVFDQFVWRDGAAVSGAARDRAGPSRLGVATSTRSLKPCCSALDGV